MSCPAIGRGDSGCSESEGAGRASHGSGPGVCAREGGWKSIRVPYQKEKKTTLTFTSFLTSLPGAAFGNPTPGLMDGGLI